MSQNSQDFYSKIEESCQQIRSIFGEQPFDLAMVLGSGLSSLVEILEDPQVIPYQDLLHFPVGDIEGHHKELIAGSFKGKRILIFSGRFHYYEGLDMKWAALPSWICAGLSIPVMLLTNVSGGISSTLRPGSLMLIKDHINASGDHPLRGLSPWKDEPQFSDMTKSYDPELATSMHRCAQEKKIPLQDGTYIFVSGPSYETPAEIQMFLRCGADAVGMSTVPEVITARRFDIRVAALSMIVNHAAGLQASIDHGEALEICKKEEGSMIELIKKWIGTL
ncbi:MAG: purine-nucleoside phosphorylase [Bdellovibrionales bacterium]|nr:purine-nucleoside phosphorylase [Bdellovibrionales bacterium]